MIISRQGHGGSADNVDFRVLDTVDTSGFIVLAKAVDKELR